MATNNQVNLGLKGSSGSGSFVGSTSPTLVTPNVGAATATSINFGGTALGFYEEGTWTPTDASGAGLSLTVATGFYVKMGNFIFVVGHIQYPSTANGSNNKIGGLPFTPNSGSQNGGQLGDNTTSSPLAAYFLTNATATTGSIYSSAGTILTNAQLSTHAYRMIITYMHF